MKKSIFNFGAMLLCFLFAGINAFSQTDEAMKQKIESLNKQMAKSMVEGNYDAAVSFYASDAISMPNNSQMLKGVEAIKSSNEMMKQSGAKFKTFETKTTEVRSCGTQFIEIGTYTMSMTIPGMQNDYQDHGKYLTIWEKQSDGSLKIKVEMWNTDVNP
ncbi:MAG TPA: DUF4440 domain-containing protein, partial [Bacteroidales bacterium]|nr:DUF4440 domain-containing protein [Bacteroidales bacterium]